MLSRDDTWGPGQVCLGSDIQRQPHLPLPAPCGLHLCLNLKQSLRSPGSSHQGGNKGLLLLSSTLGPLSQPRATRSGSRPQAARPLTQPCVAVPVAFHAALVLLWGRCDAGWVCPPLSTVGHQPGTGPRALRSSSGINTQGVKDSRSTCRCCLNVPAAIPSSEGPREREGRQTGTPSPADPQGWFSRPVRRASPSPSRSARTPLGAVRSAEEDNLPQREDCSSVKGTRVAVDKLAEGPRAKAALVSQVRSRGVASPLST